MTKMNAVLLTVLAAAGRFSASALSMEAPCPLDYTLADADTTVAPPQKPITILEQGTSHVKFTVDNYFLPSSADEIYVEYTSDDVATSECSLTTDLASCASTSVFTAQCLHTVPIAVVTLYVADPLVTDSGDGVPECCRADDYSPGNTAKYTYVLECAPNASCADGQDDRDCTVEADTAPPTSAPTDPCVDVVMDFNDLPDYGFIHDEWWVSKGVKITATGNNDAYTPLPLDNPTTLSQYANGNWMARYKPNNGAWRPDVNAGGAARVFNTQKPGHLPTFANGQFHNSECASSGNGDGDNDLGSPNQNCATPGPGVGDGGKPNSAFANCPSTPVGNVLVVQERALMCPDDNAKGGTILFEFDTDVLGPVEVVSATFLDSDRGKETPKMEFWTVGQSLSSSPSVTESANEAGNNGLDVIVFPNGIQNVKYMKVTFEESGSISVVAFKSTTCPPGDTSSRRELEADDGVRMLRSRQA